MFAENRRKLCDALQTAHPNMASSAIVYLVGGPSTTRFDSDHEPIFRQESYFWYLTGVKEPDVQMALDVASAKLTLFIPKLPASYATIMGRIKTRDEWKADYGADEVLFTDDTETTLQNMLETKSNGSPAQLLLMYGPNSDSGKEYEPPADILTKFATRADTTTLFPVLAECRVIKSAAELAILRHVTEVTSFAHAYVMRNFRPGLMEYQGESLFRHYCYYNYGCRLVGYTPICGCGPSASVLHYGHAGEPNDKPASADDICLFDMGAEYYGYGSDVTCSFPASGRFSSRQRGVYEAVLAAQVTVYNMMRPGVSYRDCHLAAEATILQHLIALGLVVTKDKTVDELVALRLGAVFMPHGLGHFIGIDTHDVGGYLPGHPERVDAPGLKSLRTSRVLQLGMVLTVEPGCYFIDHLLDEALAEESPLKAYLVADKIAAYRGFGGVRLEDVVVVTQDGCINYTLCPRTIEEVEGVMAGGKWPPMRDTAVELRRKRLTAPNPLPAPPSK